MSNKIVNSLKVDKASKIFKALSEETKIPLDQLKNYDVLTEVPLETSGGFMKADAVLIKRNALGKIEDVIIIENKLSQNTAFTMRQKEGFGAIINGQTQMNIKYDLPKQNLTVADGPLKVSKDKIFKIADGGTDNIANVSIEKIIKVK